MKALLLLLFVAVFGEDTLVYREEDGNFVEKDELDGDDVQVWFVLDSRTRLFYHISRHIFVASAEPKITPKRDNAH